MGVITFELEEPLHGDPCPCCGGRTTWLTRFVYADGDAHGVYYASFSDKHADRRVSVAISLGEWGEGSKASQRVAFALQIRAAQSQYQVSVVDAKYSPWHDAKFLGRMLNRKRALAHPLIEEVFHISDHIVTDDPIVKAYLDKRDPDPTS
jgi:hypothetical protein